jgi:uncharacterized protein (TIGR02444 family)
MGVCVREAADSTTIDWSRDVQMNEPAAADACWNFVIVLYAKQGVSQACLVLQDQLGVDVSFLLTALFHAARRQEDLTAEDIEKLDQFISVWRNETVLPLRALRRRLKEGHPVVDSVAELYRQIKAAELLAERLEIGALVQQLERISGNPAAAPSGRATIEHVVRYFANASKLNHRLDEAIIQSAVSVLVAAST